jgi:quinol monooxygenase YgiN
MAMSRLLGITVAAGLMAGIASANAQDTRAAYVVSYIDVAPASARNAAAVLGALRDASRKEAGNSGFAILQRVGQPQQFAILEAWVDTKAQASHAAAAGTAQLRDKLKPYLAAPVDERLHTGFVVGQSKASGAGSICLDACRSHWREKR